MARAPFQVIVFPFLEASPAGSLYAIFRRREHGMWQAVSGGGEDLETPAQAAMRETLEETGIVAGELIPLDSRASVPVSVFSGTEHWAKDLFVVPEYAFGLSVSDTAICLSDEHSEVMWLPFHEAHERLTWDSNKVALWELEQRLQARHPKPIAP